MELFDLYDENRTKIGKTIVRGEKIVSYCRPRLYIQQQRRNAYSAKAAFQSRLVKYVGCKRRRKCRFR